MCHLLLLFLLPIALANDGVVMLKLVNSLSPLPSGWSTTSSKDFCIWSRVQCGSNGRVTAIQLSNLGLTGTLPLELSALTELRILVFLNNQLSGDLPSLTNLYNLQILHLGTNDFTSIPSGFFKGLSSLEALVIENNANLAPWEFPPDISESTSLTVLKASNSNIFGSLPDIFGSMSSLQNLELSYNNLTGPLPPSMAKSGIHYLLLNNQQVGLTRTIDVLANMTALSQVWLNRNQFTGPIPDLFNCKSIKDLQLNDNYLTGIVPASLISLPNLINISLSNNKLQGPVPKFPSFTKVINNGINNYCENVGIPCDQQVSTLLQIARAFGYPQLLSDKWSGNYVCNWSFVSCDTQKNITGLNFKKQYFKGTISPAIANLTSLHTLLLGDNNLMGSIPDSLTELRHLAVLDVSNNNLSGIDPQFKPSVTVKIRPGNNVLKKDTDTGNVQPPETNAPPLNGNTTGVGGSPTVSKAIVAGIITVSILLIWYTRRKGFFHANAIKFWSDNVKHDETNETFTMKYHLAPKRYSYSDIIKITNSFIEVLGQGGFGRVYKGKLLDGHLVAVKVLNKSKGDGEDIMNEVASISRTSHVNIVALLGFCHQRTKRALIYEYMPNGSLEKFIHGQSNSQTNLHLEWNTFYEIAIGIARGLEYLHRDCNTRIVHFDIKHHNILLDEDFCPKISDFGLAKLCKRKESKVSMMGARGTAGYIAPEVFCRNFGEVSYKSDVYSYGMMVLEIVEGRKDSVDIASSTSQIYFPDWIYRHLESGEVSKVYSTTTDVEEEMVRKMLLVGLWSIRTHPADRPSMTRVVEMLEGSLHSLQFPPKPFLSSMRLSQEHTSTISNHQGMTTRLQAQCYDSYLIPFSFSFLS